MLWLVIAVNLGYRIYADRVSGLVTGLWRSGWPARVLLVAVIAGLASPLVYGVLRWTATRWRRLRQRVADRRTAADIPRRVDTLRSSALGQLPPEALAGLAASLFLPRRRLWLRIEPTDGSTVVHAAALARGDDPGLQRELDRVTDAVVKKKKPRAPEANNDG